MSLRIATVLLVACCLAVPASSQFGSSVVVQSDLRLFATLAALNAAGFDVELAAQYHPVRTEVRKVVSQLDPDLLRRLKDFYTSHKGRDSDQDQIAKYISLAVNLTDAPELKPAYREEVLPPDA